MRHIVAVLGYGPNITPWVKEYILSVVQFLRVRELGSVSFVVLSGGRTYASHSRSEADVMEGLLMRCADGVLALPPIIRDDESITTIQNLEALARIIRETGGGGADDVTIFCARSHEQKVHSLAIRILDVDGEKISVVGIPGLSASARQGRMNRLFQNWVVRPVELAALHWHPLRRLLEYRREQAIKWR